MMIGENPHQVVSLQITSQDIFQVKPKVQKCNLVIAYMPLPKAVIRVRPKCWNYAAKSIFYMHRSSYNGLHILSNGTKTLIYYPF